MKVAIVYNRESQRVINLFGQPNLEKYGKKNINRIVNALKSGGHQVKAFEGDKDLIDRLEEFMPRVMKHERPGMVFNLSYGIQGQARYTHVPGMLEMIGLPYVGSGPLAHSLALDKVVSKMIFKQHGLPTPDFAVLQDPGFETPDLRFPLIVKPKNEAVSFGIRICRSEKELREGAEAIFKQFDQPVLVEQYIPGREINVGIIGNNPGEALPPAEISFGKSGPQIYTYEDKTRKSGREIGVICPAPMNESLAKTAQRIARDAFNALGCYDCCRVDMRLDKDDHLYILEVNSLPSLGEHGSYVEGAAHVGLDFPALINRLVDVAATRYFGTPAPPELSPAESSDQTRIFSFLTQRRDEIERQTQQWCQRRARTSDPVGLKETAAELDDALRGLGLKPVGELTDPDAAATWQTPKGLDGGTLLVGHLDVPLDPNVPAQMFYRDAESLYGEGIGSSRAPLVSLLFALRALRRVKTLRKIPLGVLYYRDEGRDCRYSEEVIRTACGRAKRVLVLRPGNVGGKIVTGRRGQRLYRLLVEGPPLRLGRPTKRPEVLRWLFPKLEKCAQLSNRKERIAVSVLDLRTTHRPMLLPHHAKVELLASYPDESVGGQIDRQIREIFAGDRNSVKWDLELVSARPPMKERRGNLRLANALKKVAEEWEIPLQRESSVWPSAAGLIPASTAVVCGVGPIASDLFTPQESVQRISLMQRTLLLAEFLNGQTVDGR